MENGVTNEESDLRQLFEVVTIVSMIDTGYRKPHSLNKGECWDINVTRNYDILKAEVNKQFITGKGVRSNDVKENINLFEWFNIINRMVEASRLNKNIHLVLKKKDGNYLNVDSIILGSMTKKEIGDYGSKFTKSFFDK